MPLSAVPVLITRPQPQAGRLGQQLTAALGGAVRLVLSPLMAREFLAPPLPPGPHEALLLTSETGAEAAGRLRAAGQSLPDTLHCVGTRTAEVARRHGFDPITICDTAKDLIAQLRKTASSGPLLYLHGSDVSARLDLALEEAGIRATSAVVYAQRPQPLSEAARHLLDTPGPVVVPLYSPRSARLLVDALPERARAEILPCAISEAVLSALPETIRCRAVVADRPDGAAMKQAILRVISSLLP